MTMDPSRLETIQEEPSEPSRDSKVTNASSPDEGRFLPGTLIAGRYRIISLLGRGGMGEVYRATDLTLGASVALKFLPEEAARNQRMLERFHGEVRVARQVSHPNICRVYDIGEADGLPYISMEFVDGEDLASLLARIGRLPADKALEIARKLCAGLAAAHDRGVIHRDFKPQNIMVNKRGDAVIMDFGLAAIAEQLSGAEARNGTPAYMAPEQLKGAEVTARSDLYALGLVLYELFTGKRPFEAKTMQDLIARQEAAQVTSMTSIASDIDPAVEKAIRRCLDPEPARRPTSPLAVSAALPGGDPLAAALAAGETPSPDLVAASGRTEGLALKYSVPCLIVVLLSIVFALLVRDRYSFLANAQLDLPPQALRVKAREIAASLGYSKRPADFVFDINFRSGMRDWFRRLPGQKNWSNLLASEAPILLTYRESPSPLIADPFGDVTENNPPPIDPGMVYLTADGAGRLREFNAVPEEAPLDPPVAPEAVFRAAGLDFTSFTELATPQRHLAYADRVQAWKGPHPSLPNTELTIEVASWRGRVTHFFYGAPWVRRAGTSPGGGNESSFMRVRDLALLTFAGVGLAIAIFGARRNWKLGRVDHRGAFRLAALAFLLSFLVWAGDVHPVPGAKLIGFFFNAAAGWLMTASIIALLYLALEPALRSRWPHSIVTWNRALAGRWSDAQVASSILIGAAVGSVLYVALNILDFSRMDAGTLSPMGNLYQLLGVREWTASHAARLLQALRIGLVGFFVIFLLRTLLKKELLAAGVAALLFTATEGGVLNSPNWQIRAAVYALVFATLIFVMLRSGLLTTITAVFFINSLSTSVSGTDFSAWHAPTTLASILLWLAVAGWAFWRSMGNRELLPAES